MAGDGSKGKSCYVAEQFKVVEEANELSGGNEREDKKKGDSNSALNSGSEFILNGLGFFEIEEGCGEEKDKRNYREMSGSGSNAGNQYSYKKIARAVY